MIIDLKDGDRFDSQCLTVSCVVRQTKKGKPYWAAEIRDKSGILPVRMWDPPAEEPPKSGDVIRLVGSIEAYNETLQLKAEKLIGVHPSDRIPEQFLPCSERPAAEMHADLVALIGKDVKDEKLKALLLTIVTDVNIKPRLLRAPAASRYHHAFLGGLLEHILSLWGGAKGLAPNYPWVNRDIVLCACVCHDIGKIAEMQTDSNIEYTTFGKLVGHILIGARIVAAWCTKLKISDEVTGQLLHCVASHHGDAIAEVKAQTPEAVLFHYLDELDSRMGGIKPVWDATQPDVEFTERVPILGRPVYKGMRNDG